MCRRLIYSIFVLLLSFACTNYASAAITYVDAIDGEVGNTTLATGEFFMAVDVDTGGSGAEVNQRVHHLRMDRVCQPEARLHRWLEQPAARQPVEIPGLDGSGAGRAPAPVALAQHRHPNQRRRPELEAFHHLNVRPNHPDATP